MHEGKIVNYLGEACGSRCSSVMVANQARQDDRVSENQKGSHGNDAHAYRVREEEKKEKDMKMKVAVGMIFLCLSMIILQPCHYLTPVFVAPNTI